MLELASEFFGWTIRPTVTVVNYLCHVYLIVDVFMKNGVR